MKKLTILFVGVMAFALTGCCGLGGGCNSCGYGGGRAPIFGGGGGCPGGNCGTGPLSYNAPVGTTSAAATPVAGPTLATVPTPSPYHRTAMSAPVEALPTF